MNLTMTHELCYQTSKTVRFFFAHPVHTDVIFGSREIGTERVLMSGCSTDHLIIKLDSSLLLNLHRLIVVEQPRSTLMFQRLSSTVVIM